MFPIIRIGQTDFESIKSKHALSDAYLEMPQTRTKANPSQIMCSNPLYTWIDLKMSAQTTRLFIDAPPRIWGAVYNIFPLDKITPLLFL